MAEDGMDLLDQLVVGSVAVTARAIAAAGADLTFVQWRVLLVVGGCEEGATVTEIAARLGANASPASRLVSRLARRGLLRTDRSDPDRRVTRVRLTDAGRDLRSRILDRRRRLLSEVLAGAGLAPREVEPIARLARSFGAFA